MTPTKLKAFIEDHAGNFIGTYTLDGKSGVSFPAISIGEPTNGLSVSGSEVIISKFPNIEKNQRTGNYIYRCEKHCIEIYLHDYEDDDAWENFYMLVDEMMAAFPRIYNGSDIKQNKHFESLPGYKFYVKVESFREVNDGKQSQLNFGSGKHRRSVTVY